MDIGDHINLQRIVKNFLHDINNKLVWSENEQNSKGEKKHGHYQQTSISRIRTRINQIFCCGMYNTFWPKNEITHFQHHHHQNNRIIFGEEQEFYCNPHNMF